MTNSFSNHLLAGAVGAALLAGCSGGSQFAPPTGYAGPQAAFQSVAPTHTKSGHGVSPAWVDWTGISYNPATGKWQYYYINIWNQWLWIPSKTKGNGGGGSTLGGSLAKASQVDFAMTNGSIEVVSGKKVVSTLTGLQVPASALETDSRSNTFAAENISGTAAVAEFPAGSKTPTAEYADANLASINSLAIDKAGHVYVEGTSVNGGIEVDEMSAGGSFASLAPSGSSLGATPGGLAVQTSGTSTYVWINDAGNASDPANITRYAFDGKSLTKQSSFGYTGVNGEIAVDPTGKDTSHVYTMNNVSAGSEYSVSGIEYSYPSGAIAAQSSPQTQSAEMLAMWVK